MSDTQESGTHQRNIFDVGHFLQCPTSDYSRMQMSDTQESVRHLREIEDRFLILRIPKILFSLQIITINSYRFNSFLNTVLDSI
ncbi:hypothetical protein KAH27_08160 [bacterium]|nr:hypothetical protein [bacterium]